VHFVQKESQTSYKTSFDVKNNYHTNIAKSIAKGTTHHTLNDEYFTKCLLKIQFKVII